MHHYLQPQDDGLPMRSFGPWVAEKLDYLERYINIFETSMRSKPWRKIYEKWRSKQTRFGIHRLLMDHYKEKLEDLGYKEAFRDDEIGDEPLIRNAKRKAPLYRLLFASKHPLGHDFWQKVTNRDVHGQMRMRLP